MPLLMGHVIGFARFAGAGVRFALGALAALLPRRLWPSLDPYVPASGAAAVSAAATIVVACAIGIPGFLRYAGDTASAHNTAALRSWESGDPAFDGEGALRRVPMGMNALAVPMFLFLTPLGWATTYLGTTGALRLASAILDEGLGDPILTGLDTMLVRSRRGTRRTLEGLQREAMEGPEMPDRIASSAQLGITAADFVIVASRRKPGWDTGTVLLTEEGTAYRIGAIEERTIGGRLRTLYAVTLHTDLETFRRVVRYELPPGRR